jgi:hypothetical protein
MTTGGGKAKQPPSSFILCIFLFACCRSRCADDISLRSRWRALYQTCITRGRWEKVTTRWRTYVTTVASRNLDGTTCAERLRDGRQFIERAGV